MSAPAPIRLAAGLAVTAAEEAFRLPYRIASLPSDLRERGGSLASRATTTALSRALRAQQTLSSVMAKGDEVLSDFAASGPGGAEAVFDEDLDDAPAAAARAGRGEDAENATARQAARAVGYDDLDADDLQDLLEDLDDDHVRALRDHEAAGANRPGFLTLLDNALRGRGA